MIKGYSKYAKLAENLSGFYTLETLAQRLKISKAKAIYVIHRLRKEGVVKTTYGAGKKRVYYISLANKIGGISYVEKINEALGNRSGAKIASANEYYIHGREPSYEEALIFALKQKNIRYLIASLILFRKITNWSLLYKLAKKENLVREVVALYEISKKRVRKVRKMPKRFINLAKKVHYLHNRYIVQGITSQDFTEIEKKWKVYIPLNYSDLEEYAR